MLRDRLNQFLIATILFDVLLLSVSNLFSPPIDPRLYGMLAIFVVSPLLAYVLVYRLLA